METSALESSNVEAAFMQVVKAICETYQDSDSNYTESEEDYEEDNEKEIGMTKPV